MAEQKKTAQAEEKKKSVRSAAKTAAKTKAAKPAETEKPVAAKRSAQKKKAVDAKKEAVPAERALADKVCALLSAKKGEDILIIDVKEKTTLCDYFVIASGHSATQVKALCDHVEETLSKEGIEPRRTEGTKEGRWGVLDYGDVIVHVFNDETRLFYHIERLWQDGENTAVYKD